MVMVGLASVIIGEALTKKRSAARSLIFVLAGSVVYRLAIQIVLEVNLIGAQTLKLVTAVIVAAFMGLPALKEALEGSRRKRSSASGIQEVTDMVKTDGMDVIGVRRPAKGQLALEGLQVGFNLGTPMENQVLRGLDLQLAPGDFACIIGSNGAGKSTLFNGIAGSVELQAGSVALSGNDITWLPGYRRARRISRVFQDPMQGTVPDLTVAENIALAYGRSRKASLHDALPSETYDSIADQLKVLGFGLERRMDTSVGLLSGGQRQAVTLLMATIGDPDLLLLDEHTALWIPRPQSVSWS